MTTSAPKEAPTALVSVGRVIRSSPLPAWAQVAQHFKTLIDEGSVASGQRLPSETQLAADFGVSRITMRQALGHLSAEGYIDRRQGIGTFVSARRLPIHHDLSLDEPWRERLKLQGHSPVSKVIETTLTDNLPREVLTRLAGLGPVGPFAYFKRVQCIDGEPIGLTESWVPVSVARDIHLQALVEGSLSLTLRERYGLEPAFIDNVVEAVFASAADAQLLETFVDVPLFAVTATSHTQDERLLDIERTMWVAGRVRFHYLHASSGRHHSRTR